MNISESERAIRLDASLATLNVIETFAKLAPHKTIQQIIREDREILLESFKSLPKEFRGIVHMHDNPEFVESEGL